MNNIRSSYIENNYGSVLRSLIMAKEPKLVVELGVLDGYSTFNISHALRFNSKRGIESKFFAYDIFDEYGYKHGDFNKVNEMIKNRGLGKFCEIKKGNAYEVYKDFEDNSINFLHVDISNHGDTLLNILKLWGSKISDDGMIAFEGGSQDRDEGWIKKYGYKSIRNELANNPFVYRNWNFQILTPFPSMTLLFPKGEKC